MTTFNEKNNDNQLPIPSVIILKYNDSEDKKPSPESLEVGELALSLLKDHESIWAKNSAGNILDLRKPRVDLFWDDFFLHYDTVDSFINDLNSGIISETSIVYIKETRQIWTKGTFFALSEKEVLDLINSRVFVFPIKTSELNEESSSEEISEVFGGVDAFKKLTEDLKNIVSIAAIKLNQSRSLVPVSISSCTVECEYQCKYIITLEWIYGGKYYSEVITFNDDTKVFSVSRNETDSNFLEIVENLDKVLNENIELVEPKINCSWEFYNNAFKQISVYPSPDHDNPVVEKGYKVVFKGVYSWTSEDGKKDPVSISKESTWKNLTESGKESEMYTSTFLTEDTTFLVQLEAPKTGLMTRGEDVIFSNGINDVKEDKRTVRFADRIYYGTSKKSQESEFVEYDIRSLENTNLILDGNTETIVNNVSTNDDDYYIIAIPEHLGDLKGIWQDGFPIMSAFKKIDVIEVINAAGVGINYNVYVSNNPGAFTSVTVKFI